MNDHPDTTATASDSSAQPGRRSVRLERTGFAQFRATNAHGVTIELDEGGEDAFTPVELLLAAMAGCAGIDVDYITARRAEPMEFTIESSGVKRSDDGNYLDELAVTFTVSFPAGPDGDAARERLPQAIRRSAEQLCTVSRTIQRGTPIALGQAPKAPR